MSGGRGIGLYEGGGVRSVLSLLDKFDLCYEVPVSRSAHINQDRYVEPACRVAGELGYMRGEGFDLCCLYWTSLICAMKCPSAGALISTREGAFTTPLI